MKNIVFGCLLLVAVSCAHRRPQPAPDLTPAPVTSPEITQPAPPPVPTPPVAQQPLPSFTPIPVEPPAPGMESPHVALTVGGAGVASFGLVGILKRFHEEGIIVDYIVTTGWPTLFALGYTYFKSVHDLEWFAMRLQEKDFYKAGIFSSDKGFAPHDALSQLIQNSFKQLDLLDGKIPVVISAANTDLGDPEIYDRGDWKIPLLKTMSVPGIYRPYPQGAGTEWITSLQGLDVEEAIKRGSKNIVVIDMYDDYFNFLKTSKKDEDSVFRKLYLSRLRKTISQQIKDVRYVGKITTKNAINDFAGKRVAIFNGYKEGARLAKLIRSTAQK